MQVKLYVTIDAEDLDYDAGAEDYIEEMIKELAEGLQGTVVDLEIK